jgi:hypothetical protein
VETERGVSFEFGKFVALISFSGKTFKRLFLLLLIFKVKKINFEDSKCEQFEKLGVEP